MNDTGSFNYYEANVNEEDLDFVMNGTITVVAQQQELNAPSTIAMTPAANSGVNSTSVLGNTLTVSGQNTSNTTFTAPTVAGGDVDFYLFELSVTDNDGLIASDFAKVVVARGVGQE